MDSVLKDEVLPPTVASFQLRQYILRRVADPPAPLNSAQWTADQNGLRAKLLKDVVFHGWPKAWIEAEPKFQEEGIIQGDGYRIRKLRYEIVPGFESVALLYEPLNVQGKIPAILNVNGHVGAPGKSVEYKQKRCITFARNGILALNLEWLSYGELSHEWNDHAYGSQLDLVGVNELGLFYLEMRKGLDYLNNHPHTDRARVGMTGLSGGGWQTIVLSSLDERVRASVPVAGFSSIKPRVEAKRFGDLGDIEQSATDLFEGRDYPHLAAMMAPRPTLLTYNAEDDCCFRAAMVKPLIFDAIRPIFALYGKQDDLAWHENRDPGTHNYQLDNRMASYDFFARHFNLPPIQEEPGISAQVLSYADLVVGLPANNFNIVTLARSLADRISRQPLPTDSATRNAERAKLREVVRYRPVTIDRIWTIGVTKHGGVETKSHLFTTAEGLTSSAVWLKPIGSPDTAPLTVILDDRGKQGSSSRVTEALNRGEPVIALDLPFFGAAWPDRAWEHQQLLNTIGERPLGIEAAHLIAITRQLHKQVRLQTSGIRSQVVALAAAAIEPTLFSEVDVRDGMPSLRYLIDKPVKFEDAPELFCLDLYRFTDLDRLMALAKP
jgi:dienelactone hydrolase